ncbi:restriction endonuclease subunit S [Agathobaculum sp.]|uniref:restriction endonuclease subunit S n=1 Tax=Agathobaculum sp. TaxID=2048138 RepID=UPI003520700D
MDTKALRQKILDLAIRGKLVPQDPNDEPASVLLERIREQKQQMVKEGKLKKKDIKNDSVIFVGEDNLHYEKFADGSVKCIEDEIPFELPEGWAWARFSTITINRDSERKPISSSQRTGVEKIYDYYGASGKIDKIDKYIFCERLLLIGEDGANLVTRSKPIAFFAEGLYWVNNHAHCIDSPDKLLLEYLCFYINAISLEKYVTGSAQPKMTQDNMNSILIPLPPYNEQKRLSQHLDEIMAMVDRIEIGKIESIELISKAKSQILDLAIRGKLVPQDPNDEPASVLLERIRAEKEELIKQGKIKRDKKESVIFKGEDNSYYVRQDTHTEAIDEQFIFELPDNWEWCSLLNIAKMELGKTLDSAKNTGINYPYLRSVNVRWNDVDLSDLKEMRFEPEELERYTVRLNDLLICEGGDVGRSCVWTDDKEILYQNALHRVRFYGECNPFYFMYYMMYYESLGIIKALCKGVTIKHLTGNVLSLIPFALPPIKEQSRIVEKLNQIFTLIDCIISD